MRYFTGFVAHTVQTPSFEGEPVTVDQQYEVTIDAAKSMVPKMTKLPVVNTHKKDLVLGTVEECGVCEGGQFVARVAIDDTTLAGKAMISLIDRGMFDHFSLSHNRLSNTPLHLALCWKGAREDTFIFDNVPSATGPCKTNNPRDKQAVAAAPVIVNASATAAAAAAQMLPSQSMGVPTPSPIYSTANGIFQGLSDAMASAGLGAPVGSDAANRLAQQQQQQAVLQQMMHQLLAQKGGQPGAAAAVPSQAQGGIPQRDANGQFLPRAGQPAADASNKMDQEAPAATNSSTPAAAAAPPQEQLTQSGLTKLTMHSIPSKAESEAIVRTLKDALEENAKLRKGEVDYLKNFHSCCIHLHL